MGRGPTQQYFKAMNSNYIEGTLTCLRPDVIKAKISTEFPLVLNIEPTNACNAKCYYCPRERTIQSQGENYLDFSIFRKIIDQISGHKLIMLNLHKDGESLLHHDLPEMVGYARKKDAAQIIHLNTNGTLINTKTGKSIIENEIDDITVSIDAAREETYQKLKKIKGLVKLEENIKKAIDYRNRIHSKTRIRVKIMEFDDVKTDEIEFFREKWKDVADEVQVTGVHNWSGAIEGFAITDEQTHDRYPCALLWYMLAINSNGKVSICNVDYDYSGVVGDIHKQSIKEIWNGDLIKNVRVNQLNGIWEKPHVCEECVVWVSVGNIWEFLQTRNEFISFNNGFNKK